MKCFIVGCRFRQAMSRRDHRVLLLVAAVIGAIEAEVAQAGELTLDAVEPTGVGRHVTLLAARPLAHPLVGLGAPLLGRLDVPVEAVLVHVQRSEEMPHPLVAL